VLSTDYGTLPPVWKARPRSPCRVQKLSAVEGYVVGPDEPVTIAVMYRTLNPGRFSIAGERVVYEQEGEVHKQVVRFVIAGIVKADARPSPLGTTSRRARTWPGSSRDGENRNSGPSAASGLTRILEKRRSCLNSFEDSRPSAHPITLET
jgi:hypothetical protein